MNLYADQKTMRELVAMVREQLDAVESTLLNAVSPDGAADLRRVLEEVNTVDIYDPFAHGTLFRWAIDTVAWLDAERRRHGDQVTAIHTILRNAGHTCARGKIEETLTKILKEERSS